MKPHHCPRCKRTQEAWAVEADKKRAGCTCGEVFEITLDDDPQRVKRLSVLATRPPGWSETQLPNGWSAQLRPKLTLSLERFAFLPLSIGVYLLFVSLGVHDLVGKLLLLGLSAAGLLYGLRVLANAIRPWTFEVERGRFHAATKNEEIDLPLEDVLFVSAESEQEGTGRRATFRYRLCIHREHDVLRVPLRVQTADQAQYIADRANAALASEGRDMTLGYRGERLRIELDAPAEPAKHEEVAEEDPGDDERRQKRVAE